MYAAAAATTRIRYIRLVLVRGVCSALYCLMNVGFNARSLLILSMPTAAAAADVVVVKSPGAVFVFGDLRPLRDLTTHIVV